MKASLAGRATLLVSDSGGGTIYGRLINHRAALASTARIGEAIPLLDTSSVLRKVAEHPRCAGHTPFTVVHDSTVNRPFGRYAVYIGQRRIGAQLSVPSASDCARMENPPAPLAVPVVTYSKTTRRALGLMSPEDRVERNRQQREWRAARRAGPGREAAKS